MSYWDNIKYYEYICIHNSQFMRHERISYITQEYRYWIKKMEENKKKVNIKHIKYITYINSIILVNDGKWVEIT